MPPSVPTEAAAAGVFRGGQSIWPLPPPLPRLSEPPSSLVLSLPPSLSPSLSLSPWVTHSFSSLFSFSPHPLIFLTLIVWTFCLKPMTLVEQYNVRDYVFLTNSQEQNWINNPSAYHFLYEIELNCWTSPGPSIICESQRSSMSPLTR